MRGSRGQTLVEFALSASVMLLLLFAVIDFGRALYEYNQLSQAARLGARWAIVNTPLPPNDCAVPPPNGACQSAIRSYLVNKSGIDATRLTTNTAITFGPTGTCSAQPVWTSHTCWVNVHLEYQFNWLLLPLGNHPFTADSRMYLVSQYCGALTPCPQFTPQ